jgi:hypothetical protein
MPGLEETENEFRWRLQEPSLFKPDSFRSKEITAGVSLIMGKKEGSDTMEAQALRFDKSKFNKEEARKWIEEHKGKFSQEEGVLIYELPETFNISDVEIFATGQWNGDKYIDSDLEDIVRSFEETKLMIKPYLKLGHDDDQLLAQRDGLPAIGWVDRLKKIGNKLIADFSNVPKKIYELIKAGAYRRISSEIFFNAKIDNKTYPKLLKAVSLLGGDTPAVQNLNDIISLYNLDIDNKIYKDKNEIKTYEFQINEEGDMPKPDEKPNDEKQMQDAGGVEGKIKELEKQIAELIAERDTLKKSMAVKDEELKAKDAKCTELEQSFSITKEELEKSKIVSKEKEIEIEVDKIISDPKTFAMPADKDVLKTLIFHLDTSEIKKYKVGEEEKTVADMFRMLLNREQVKLNTEEQSETGETSNVDNSALHNKALKYAKENNVDYKTALFEISK